MFEEKIIIRITITEVNTLDVLEQTQLYKDGEFYCTVGNHRYALSPGEDVSDRPEKVQLIANILWTPEVIENYNNIERVVF